MQSFIHLQQNGEMTGYKFMKRTRMCSERTDIAIRIGRSPLCDWSLIICYMFFFNINAPFGSDYFVSIFQHNLGEKLLYSHPFLFAKGGEMAIQSFFRRGGAEIYYIAISPPIQIRGKYGYIAIFRGKNGSKTPARIIIIRFADIQIEMAQQQLHGVRKLVIVN